MGKARNTHIVNLVVVYNPAIATLRVAADIFQCEDAGAFRRSAARCCRAVLRGCSGSHLECRARSRAVRKQETEERKSSAKRWSRKPTAARGRARRLEKFRRRGNVPKLAKVAGTIHDYTRSHSVQLQAPQSCTELDRVGTERRDLVIVTDYEAVSCGTLWSARCEGKRILSGLTGTPGPKLLPPLPFPLGAELSSALQLP